MLLAKIIAEEESRFSAFNGMAKKQAFVGMVNDLISEMKQFNTKPEDISKNEDISIEEAKSEIEEAKEGIL